MLKTLFPAARKRERKREREREREGKRVREGKRERGEERERDLPSERSAVYVYVPPIQAERNLSLKPCNCMSMFAPTTLTSL